MKKIAVFGACREGVDAYRALYAASLFSKKEIEFTFLDNDSRLNGGLYEGCKIFKPTDIDLQQFEQIIIGIIAFDRAYQQLTSLGVEPKIIKRFYAEIYFSKLSRKVGMAIIGKFSYFKPSTILYNVEIGNYCHIGADCRLGLIGHNINSITTYPLDYQFGKSKDDLDCSKDKTGDLKRLSPLKISNDVYIGEGVTIMSGLTIGTGAIIGSKSVVTKDVPPFCVYAGTPAKKISERLNSEIQQKIIASKWWELDETEATSVISKLGIELYNSEYK